MHTEMEKLIVSIINKQWHGGGLREAVTRTLCFLPLDVIKWIEEPNLFFYAPIDSLGACIAWRNFPDRYRKTDLIYLNSDSLCEMSDKTATWVIAHEIAHSFTLYHVANLRFKKEKVIEEAANDQAIKWGFVEPVWRKCHFCDQLAKGRNADGMLRCRKHQDQYALGQPLGFLPEVPPEKRCIQEKDNNVDNI